MEIGSAGWQWSEEARGYSFAIGILAFVILFIITICGFPRIWWNWSAAIAILGFLFAWLRW